MIKTIQAIAINIFFLIAGSVALFAAAKGVNVVFDAWFGAEFCTYGPVLKPGLEEFVETCRAWDLRSLAQAVSTFVVAFPASIWAWKHR